MTLKPERRKPHELDQKGEAFKMASTRKHVTTQALKPHIPDLDVCHLIQHFDRIPILEFFRVTMFGVYTNHLLWEDLIYQDHYGLQRQSFENYPDAQTYGNQIFVDSLEKDTKKAMKIVQDILEVELDEDLFSCEVLIRDLKDKDDWTISESADAERIDIWRECFQNWDNTYHPYDEAKDCVAWLQVKYEGEQFFTKCVYITRIEIDLNSNDPILDS